MMVPSLTPSMRPLNSHEQRAAIITSDTSNPIFYIAKLFFEAQCGKLDGVFGTDHCYVGYYLQTDAEGEYQTTDDQ